VYGFPGRDYVRSPDASDDEQRFGTLSAKGYCIGQPREGGKLKGILESQSSRKIYRKLKQVGNLKEEKKIF